MIVAEHLTKYYGPHAAVQNVGFTIESQEVVGLLGLNGAGKTTTLRILSGVLLPTAGRVLIDGVNMADEPEAVRKRIGFLPETPPLYPEMSVEGYVKFVANIKGMPTAEIPAALEEALEATDLLKVRHQRIDTLSYGYRKRVGIAQAIVHRPALILLDEPTGGLDPVQVVHMRDLINRLRKKHTIIVSSHVLTEIHQLCDRLIVLQDGKIVGEGTESELANRIDQATKVNIEVRGGREKLEQVLSAMSSVHGKKILEPSNGVTQAIVELEHDAREDLASALVNSGLGLRRLQRVELELESVFLKIAGKSEQTSQKESQS